MEGVKIKNEQYRKHFEPILIQWIEIINNFTNNVEKDDALYYYGERLLVSTLAGAVWKKGYYAFEEFEVYKSRKTLEKSGWIDLWLYCDKPKTEYLIEAKQVFSPLPLNSAALNKISSGLKMAQETVSRIILYDDFIKGQEVRLGGVFIVPQVRIARKDEAKFLATKFIDQLEKMVAYDILGYTFPMEIGVIDGEIDKYFSLGVAFLGHTA